MVEQTINIFALIEYIGILFTIIVSSIIITRAIKRGYQSYIDTKINIVDMKILNIEKEIEEHKTHNEKEHDRLTFLFDLINQKLDKILSNKSS